jgi:hypothetical protein
MTTTKREEVEMSTTVVRGTNTAGSAAAPRRSPFEARRRTLVVSAVVLALAMIGLGTWYLVEQASGAGQTPAAVRAWGARPWPWVAGNGVVRLEQQLVGAGYSLTVDRRLDPVSKSALADYLRPSSAHPLSPSLAAALEGTVLTGRRDPFAWNRRFGLNRRTRFVERPLTGPSGQLDANGNVRAWR